MIPRYTRPVMAKLWSQENQYQKWLEVEILACEALSRWGHIPPKDLAVIKKKARFSVERIEELEQDHQTRRHRLPDQCGRTRRPGQPAYPSGIDLFRCSGYLHGRPVERSRRYSLGRPEGPAGSDLKEQALAHKKTVMIGRSHGIHAEPITFGLKLAIWYDESRRNLRRLEQARETIAVGKISGAVGTFAHISPRWRPMSADIWGSNPPRPPARSSSGTAMPSIFAPWPSWPDPSKRSPWRSGTSSGPRSWKPKSTFPKGRKAPRPCPTRRNPIASENLAGLARLIRGYALAALENQALWHERDISHSSVERVIGPDATTLLDYMLARLTGLIKNLIVYPENMKQNLEITRGLPFSEGILLALTRKGISREEAYQVVQENAMKVWADEGNRFQDLLAADPRIQKWLKPKELAACSTWITR